MLAVILQSMIMGVQCDLENGLSMGHPLERVNNKIGDCTFFSNATFGQVGG